MDYINAAGTVVDAQGRPQFADKIPGSVQGTDLCAAVFNPTVNELIGAIEASGQPRSAADETQIALAMAILGNPPVWSSAMATRVGGLRSGFLVADPVAVGKYWVSTADNNLTAPGASGASWKSFNDYYVQQISGDYGSITGATIDNATQQIALLSSKNVWYYAQPAGDYITPSGWTTAHGQTGYRICPDGEIEMWGLASVPASGGTFSQTNFNFPISFPTLCYGVHGTARGVANANGGWPSISADEITPTGARLTAEVFGNTTYNFSNQVPIFWTARGH